ncbi:MAG: NADH-quinone oxidoreductase subunit C [Bacteroidia bacterium]|nr:NADH-quinone oxidoreductase subunit C [Bacteroidia bacterium]
MNAFLEPIQQALSKQIKQVHQYAGETVLEVDASNLYSVLKALKEQFGFTYLSDVISIDHFTEHLRFEVQYNIYNFDTNKRLRVKCRVEEDNPEVDSAVSIWPAANWFEREAYDMMGIRFRNHPDLRRMYMPEDFEYYPLRKEFPLIGIPGSIQMPEKDPPKPYK